VSADERGLGPPGDGGGRPAAHGTPHRESTTAKRSDSSPILRVPAISEDDGTLGAALKYAKAGFYVLPVEPDSKRPAHMLGNRWQEQSSRDVEQIAAWFAAANLALGLHVGRSGAVVFDVDEPELVPDLLRDHALSDLGVPYQSTRTDVPERGHYVFQVPEGRRLGNGRGQLVHPEHGKAWGEVRGANGIIVVEPSLHVKPGGRYAWERTGVVPVLPQALLDVLPRQTETPEDAAADAEVEAFLDRHTEARKPASLKGVLTKFTRLTKGKGSRHEAAVEVTCWAMREAAKGLYPAREAAEQIREAFVASLAGEQGRFPRSEFRAILAWAIGQIPPPPLPEPPPEPITLDEAHKVFTRWLGEAYDLGALDVVLAAAAVERLGGDPVWLLMVSGSGNAKTETIGALAGAGAHVTSTITSEGALLSASASHETAADATGGLLLKIGSRGILVLKDFTSILSMNRDARASVLAALREVYDGKWERNVGTDGGKTLTWTGRLVVIGATTSKYDAAHEVISAMGDRFGLVRVDSNLGRLEAGRQALRNVDREPEMRADLSRVVGRVLAGIDPERAVIGEDVEDELLRAADLVTLTRTAVERDFQGNVLDAHQPEAPTRFAKYLGQIVRGGLALGMSQRDALVGAHRVAGDSMPPLRLLALADVAAHPGSRTSEVQKRLQKPRTTVDRVLQELHILGLLRQDEPVAGTTGWTYCLASGVDREALARLVTRNVTTQGLGVERQVGTHVPTDIPGDGRAAPTAPPATDDEDEDPFGFGLAGGQQ
jgi:hypothetical protein